jgi:hypothetical protein
VNAPITLPNASDIAVDQIPATLVALAALQSALAARLLVDSAPMAEPGPDELVDVKEAAKKLNVSVGWLYHRRDLPFRVSVGGKALFSAAGIARYMKMRQGRGI